MGWCFWNSLTSLLLSLTDRALLRQMSLMSCFRLSRVAASRWSSYCCSDTCWQNVNIAMLFGSLPCCRICSVLLTASISDVGVLKSRVWLSIRHSSSLSLWVRDSSLFCTMAFRNVLLTRALLSVCLCRRHASGWAAVAMKARSLLSSSLPAGSSRCRHS